MDGRPNRRNQAAFSNSPGLVWTGQNNQLKLLFSKMYKRFALFISLLKFSQAFLRENRRYL